MAKGDLVTVGVRTPAGVMVDTHKTRANGRKITAEVHKDSGLNWLVVSETTRGGTEVKVAHYQLTEVVSWTHDRE